MTEPRSLGGGGAGDKERGGGGVGGRIFYDGSIKRLKRHLIPLWRRLNLKRYLYTQKYWLFV